MSLPATITSSIYTNQVYTNIVSLPVDSTATNIQVTNAINISGYDSTLYSTPLSFSPENTTQIGLRVENNIMTRSLLTISDKRVKNNIIDSDINTDLNSLLNIPVHKYNFIDRYAQTHTQPHTQTIGFIAQEIEKVLPDAVNTVTNAIPSVMAVCKFKTDTEIYYDIPEIYNNDTAYTTELIPGVDIKLIHTGKEIIRKVVNININTILNRVEILLDTSIDTSTDTSTSNNNSNKDTIFLYGHYVNDFKLINNERLMPLVFNSVKALYNKIESHESTINSILTRLNNIQEFLFNEQIQKKLL
jgi:hypothetical protein